MPVYYTTNYGPLVNLVLIANGNIDINDNNTCSECPKIDGNLESIVYGRRGGDALNYMGMGNSLVTTNHTL